MSKTKSKLKTASQQETGGDCNPRLVRRWGVYCAAALKADPKALPRYTYPTKEAAEKSLPQMDRECASRAKHFVKIIPPNVGVLAHADENPSDQ